MYGTILKCAIIVQLMTGLITVSEAINREPDCRFNYKSLAYACAQGAEISAIPSPCCFSHIRYLELKDNRVTSLRKREFSRRFFSLHEVDLSNNRISRIYQGAFLGLRKLLVLDLTGNRLNSLPGGVFRGLSSLTTLHLSGNGMVSIHQGAFTGLSSLTVLNLDGNNLQELREEVFEPLRRLQSLHLDSNQLISLHPESFSGLHQLQTLTMANNYLQTLPDFLGEVPELERLELSGNPLVCDCRIEFLRRWLLERSKALAGESAHCSSPLHFQGQRLDSIRLGFLCQTGQLWPNVAVVFPRHDPGHPSTTTPLHWNQGVSPQVGRSWIVQGSSVNTHSTPSPHWPVTASERFFYDIPGLDSQIPPPLAPPDEPEIPWDPGSGPAPTSTIFAPVTRPNFAPVEPGFVTPHQRTDNTPNGRPDTTYPTKPQGTTSDHRWTTHGPPEIPNINPGGNDVYPESPTGGPEDPNAHPDGTSDHPDKTSMDVPGTGVTGSKTESNHTSDQEHLNETDIVLTPELTNNPNGTSLTLKPNIENDVPGGSSSTTGSPSSPLVIYGVAGHTVVLLCGEEDLDSSLRVKWLSPGGRPITNLNDRFQLKANGALKIYPLRRSDAGNYRCIVRRKTSSRVILVRLRSACPCINSASYDEHIYDDVSPGGPYPAPPYACSWTPLVIAVVTTFQGTVVACALVFCIWYTRCHRRKNFTVHDKEADKRSSRRLRNSNVPVLRHCSTSTLTSVTDSSRSTTFGPALQQLDDSLNTSMTQGNGRTLSDYMNAYVTQQMRRQHHLRLPVPDYVDLDPKSRDPNDTLYSSLSGRDLSNRRRRVVTQ